MPEFLGLNVNGEINQRQSRTPQRSLSEFGALIQAVLDDELISSFGWVQYTPGFNDGDPCEFHAREPWFRTTVDPPRGDYDGYDGDYNDSYTVAYSNHPTLGEVERTNYRGEYPNVIHDTEYKSDHVETLKKCYALAEGIDSGAFDDVLLNGLGDNTEVVVTRDGIDLEYYDCGH